MFDFSIFRVRRPQTPKELRWGGALMVVLGLVVLTGGAAFAWLLIDLPIPARWLPAGTRIERGPPEDGPSDLQRASIAAVADVVASFVMERPIGRVGQ